MFVIMIDSLFDLNVWEVYNSVNNVNSWITYTGDMFIVVKVIYIYIYA